MTTITLAKAAPNSQLAFQFAVERAVAQAEGTSPADHAVITEILDRMADGSNMPEDHDRLVQLVKKYVQPQH
jgi:phage-related baseplate assembly protein